MKMHQDFHALKFFKNSKFSEEGTPHPRPRPSMPAPRSNPGYATGTQYSSHARKKNKILLTL